VVRGDRGRVVLNRVEVRCVDDVSYPRFSGRLDGGALLVDPGADGVGADKQQLLSARAARSEISSGWRVVRITSDAGMRSRTIPAVARPRWPDAPVIMMLM
jgi:hypothetical protein